MSPQRAAPQPVASRPPTQSAPRAPAPPVRRADRPWWVSDELPPPPPPPVAKPVAKPQAMQASARTECTNCATVDSLTQLKQIGQAIDTSRGYEPFTRAPNGRVSEGIRKVTNTIYQSCGAYNKAVFPDYCQAGFIGGWCGHKAPRAAGDMTAFDNPADFFSISIASKPGGP